MGTQNSDSEFYSELIMKLHEDLAERLQIRNETLTFEREKLRSRIKKEGLAFLTQILPSYGKAVDTALANDTQLHVRHFRKEGPYASYPRFLGWLMSCIFTANGHYMNRTGPFSYDIDTETAYLTGDLAKGPRANGLTGAEALKHFRQFVYLLYKLKIPHDEETTQKVINTFVETDAQLPTINLDDLSIAGVLTNARRIASDVFGTFDEMDIVPAHGPGTVATGEDTIDKTIFKRIVTSIERKYPFTEYFMFNLNHVCDDYRGLESLEVVEAGTAKVVLVPKDSRGPRLISCEPLEVQYIQQGLSRKMVSRIESHPLTKGHVNFTCQDINRDLAMLGSMNDGWVRERSRCHPYVKRSTQGVDKYGWVTLDMKEASDRVSLDLVKEVFSLTPGLLDALIATRSTHTVLPSGTKIALKKFAPMGSALCFPVESFIFYALIVGALMYERKLTRREARQRVYVYGDDIIMQQTDYSVALQFLPKVGLMFNDQKCCTKGSFRESCGCDAFQGIDVTPTRLRAVWSSRLSYDPEILYSYAAFSNAMYKKGYMGVANYVRDAITSVYGEIPYTDRWEDHLEMEKSISSGFTSANASGVVFYANHNSLYTLNAPMKFRYNTKLQRGEYMSWRAVPRKVQTPHDGYPEMLRRRTSAVGETSGSYAVRHRSRLQRRWIVAH